MGILRKLKNKIVYALTDKPEHYVHVDKPKTLQDHRQIQYNNWCKRNGVYCGSYLPEDPDTLTKKGKGWVEITPSAAKKAKPDQMHYQRKSTGQIVRYDSENDYQYAHYHWENRKSLSDKSQTKNTFYKDRYGKVAARGSDASHLAPKDRKYIKKK